MSYETGLFQINICQITKLRNITWIIFKPWAASFFFFSVSAACASNIHIGLVSRVCVRYIVRLKQPIPLIITLWKYLTSRKLLVSNSKAKIKEHFSVYRASQLRGKSKNKKCPPTFAFLLLYCLTAHAISTYKSPSQPGFRPYSSSLSSTLARTAGWPHWSSVIFVFSPVRSRVCGVAALESILPTAGVWSRVLDESSAGCVRRITLLKMGWKCPYAVVANVLQIVVPLLEHANKDQCKL